LPRVGGRRKLCAFGPWRLCVRMEHRLQVHLVASVPDFRGFSLCDGASCHTVQNVEMITDFKKLLLTVLFLGLSGPCLVQAQSGVGDGSVPLIPVTEIPAQGSFFSLQRAICLDQSGHLDQYGHERYE